MDDYISRQAAIAIIYGQHIGGKEACENARPNTYGADLREIVADIEDIPPADVRPVAEIDEAVDEAIRILNAINSRGNIDYADYCEMYDVISAISPNCGADMREEESRDGGE